MQTTKDQLTINAIINQNANNCIIIEGVPNERKTMELSNFNKFFNDLLSQVNETKSQPIVNITLGTRQELVCPIHELPSQYRQDDEIIFDIKKVPKAFKKEIRVIIFEAPKVQIKDEIKN